MAHSVSNGSLEVEANASEAKEGPSVADFVSQASHDLKTPLAAISGYAATLERRGDALDASLRSEMLRHIRGAASRMQKAVEQLVEYARLELGAIEFELVPVDVSEVVGDVVRSISEAGNDFALEVDATGPHIAMADRARLVGAVSCLLENAVRYGRGRCRVRVEESQRFVSVTVEDAGEGVPEELENFLFSADLEGRPRSGQPHGLGIALHNARRIVRLFGGDIRLLSPRSRGEYPGAIFEIRIPRINEGSSLVAEGG